MHTTLVETQLAEDQLIEAAKQGDRDAFGELVLMHYQGTINVVYRMTGEMPLAEDVAQETFIRAWTKLHTYRPIGSFRSWVYRIANNAALDILRRQAERENDEGLTTLVNQLQEQIDTGLLTGQRDEPKTQTGRPRSRSNAGGTRTYNPETGEFE